LAHLSVMKSTANIVDAHLATLDALERVGVILRE
jgi:hypothetical protein